MFLILQRVATGRRSRDGCGGGTLAMVNLASKYLGSGSLGRPPLPPSCLPTILQACWCSFGFCCCFTSTSCWRLYFVGALLVDGISKSNAGRHLCRPSLLWGFLPPKGVGWRYAAFGCAPPVLPSARREVVVSCDVLVRLLLPTLSPHSVGNPSQFVGGWPQDGVVAMGVVVALWLW